MLTRFAPSPTGYLHLGHALAAKEAFGSGPCLLRIEDIDHTRYKPDFTEAIYDDLAWLGFNWPKPVRIQREHMADFFGVIINLVARGLAYPCTLSRSHIKANQSPQYREMSQAEHNALMAAATAPFPSLPFAIRLNLAAALGETPKRSLAFKDHTPQRGAVERDAAQALQEWLSQNRPDPIIGRKDIGVSYHIAVTHDDALQNITHVVRGMDLFEETPIHVLIQALMGWPRPDYHHHALMLRPDGKKFSKRDADISIKALREKGLTAEQVLAMAKP